MVKRIFEKAELIPVFQPGERPSAPPNGEGAKSKTAPGTMMGFLTKQSNAMLEAEALRVEVKSLKEGSPLQKLDPAQVNPSKWANRHATAFATSEFEALKSEIMHAGENVQPIKVRPIANPEHKSVSATDAAAGANARYEIIYGHRRHRACLELGLPVTAIVQDADDVSLFEQMERENRGRKNLSAWEQGKMYGRALDGGLYPSQRKLAERLGVDLALVSKSLALARLPAEVVETFASPLDIQFRWAAALSEAMQKDPDGMLARARAIKLTGGKLEPASVLQRLISDAPAETASGPLSVTIHKSGTPVGQLRVDATGRLQVTLKAGTLTQAKAKALAKWVEEFVSK